MALPQPDDVMYARDTRDETSAGQMRNSAARRAGCRCRSPATFKPQPSQGSGASRAASAFCGRHPSESASHHHDRGSITNRKGSASQHESALDQVPRLYAAVHDTNSHAIQAGVVNAAPVVVSKSAGPPAGRTVNTRLGRGRLLLAARPAPAESTEWLRAAEAPQSRQLTCRHSRSSPISSESRS